MNRLLMAKHILYLSYDGMTDPLGQSQVLPYLQGLRRKGYEIWLISFEKPVAYAENEAVIRRICEEAGINWHPVSYTKKPPLLSTLFDIRRMQKKAASIHREHRIDLVHCRSYIAATAGLWMKRKYQIPFLFDMRGFWPDERVDGNLWNLANPLYRQVYNFFKRKEREFLEQADHTVCLTHAAVEEIHSWQQVSNNPVKLTVIPCCVDMDHFDPLRITGALRSEWRTRLGIETGDRILSYVGSVGTWYMPDEMLDFFKIAMQADKRLRFLFITRDEPETILQKARQKDIDPDRIIIRGGSRQEMPALISLSDYSIFFIKPAYSKKASSPTKQAEIMRLGVPLVCNDLIGDTSMIIRQYQAGVVLDGFNESDYRRAVDDLLNTSFDRERIQQGALEFYDLETGVTLYDKVYRELLTKP